LTHHSLIMQDIVDLGIELTVYRKGSLSCHVDLERGIMTWEESRQWCNNFIRSLSDEQVDETRQILADSGLLHAVLDSVNGESGIPPGGRTDGRIDPGALKNEKRGSSLRLSLATDVHTFSMSGDFLDQTAIRLLLGQIEKLSRVPFKL
jgi:hypothetical protein